MLNKTKNDRSIMKRKIYIYVKSKNGRKKYISGRISGCLYFLNFVPKKEAVPFSFVQVVGLRKELRKRGFLEVKNSIVRDVYLDLEISQIRKQKCLTRKERLNSFLESVDSYIKEEVQDLKRSQKILDRKILSLQIQLKGALEESAVWEDAKFRRITKLRKDRSRALLSFVKKKNTSRSL